VLTPLPFRLFLVRRFPTDMKKLLDNRPSSFFLLSFSDSFAIVAAIKAPWYVALFPFFRNFSLPILFRQA